jgi:DNA-binding transcriptional ArsR family regulator
MTMTEDANLQLSLQRRQQVREEDAALEERQRAVILRNEENATLADKLRRSVDIIEQQKRQPLSEVPAAELLERRKAIDVELASRRERLAKERAHADRELAVLTRAGIVKPRATRRDKGTTRLQSVPKDLYQHGDVPEDL